MRKSFLLFAAICCAVVTMASAPEGALPGLFSVANGKQVYFSQGNLQIKPIAYEWRFAPYQYERAGADNALIAGSADVFIDLFGWATSGWVGSTAKAHMPWDASTNDADYILGNDFHIGMLDDYAHADWGIENAIPNGGNKAGLWRTLTSEEWEYLLFDRPNAASKMAVGSVGDVHGLIILPDEWTQPSGLSWDANATKWTTNRYAQSVVEWDKMQKAGALFLPCAGFRDGDKVNAVNSTAGYWAATYYDNTSASGVSFEEILVDIAGFSRHQGLSVRLVHDAEMASGINANPSANIGGSQKIIRNGQLFIEKNGKTYNVLGAEVK